MKTLSARRFANPVRVAENLNHQVSRDVTDAYLSTSALFDQLRGAQQTATLLDRLEGNGVKTVVVEDASRFARDLVTQELGLLALIQRGVRVLTANGDDLTDTSAPSRVMMRQIAGSFAQYEKARVVAKLRGARERVRAVKGKCEGRKSFVERDPEMVYQAKRLHRRSPKGHQRSLRKVARELAAMGYVNKSGQPHSASSIRSMLVGVSPSSTSHPKRQENRACL